mgnify:CR=1 FL=1
MASNDFVVVKGKIYIAKINISGVMMAFVNRKEKRVSGIYSLVATGNDLFKTSIDTAPSDLIENIRINASQYDEQKEMEDRLYVFFTQRVRQDTIVEFLRYYDQEDEIAAENAIKRIMKSALSMDTMDMQAEFESISYGEYSEMMVITEMDRLSYSQKRDIAKKYTDGDEGLADEIVKNNVQDLVLVRFAIRSRGQVPGIGLFIYSTVLNRILFVVLKMGTHQEVAPLTEVKSMVELYRLVGSDYSKTGQTDAVTQSIVTQLKGMEMDILANALKSGDTNQVAALLKQAIAPVNIPEVRIGVTLTPMNSVHLDKTISPSDYDKSKKIDEEVSEEDAKDLRKLVNVDIVLSPTSGKKVSQLQQGDIIYVLIDTSTPHGYNVADALNLIHDGKNTPIEGEVYSVNYTKNEGYKIFVRITETLYGKSIEEQDVRVKSKIVEIEEDISKSKNSMIIGIVAGVIVLAIILYILLG